MEFRTKVEILNSYIRISHRSRLLMLGSCFIENIGKQLIDNKFDVDLNPFGILYNPASIARSLQILLDNYQFTEKDVFQYKGLYNSFLHHGLFSHADKEEALSHINKRIDKASEYLENADFLIITFGTSYIFRHKKSNTVVSNCHKLPAASFERYMLSVTEIADEWISLIGKMQGLNPALKIIFTVSPIRHMKDGAHDNQLSKSTLLLAVDKICKSAENCYYFPSYEIVMDELRDYRFYNEDMVHPSPIAVKYIWERFCEAYTDESTQEIMREWRKIQQSLDHRPLNTQSDDYKHFLRQTLLKLKAFADKYPYICCNEEISVLESKL